AMGAGQSAMLNYSRMDENEADQIGLQYLCKAGLDPKGMVEAFKVLRQKSRMSGSQIPTYLSTHPAIGDRITGLSARIAHLPKEIRTRTSDNHRFLRVQTLLWARYGDAQAAMQRFRGNDALSLMGQGIVLARQNSVGKAQEAFSRALASAPTDSLILREAGAFHYRKGNLRESEGLLRRALASNPSDYMASFYLGRLLADSGDHAKAIAYFRDVLLKVPQESEVHEAYARALSGQGQTARAFVHMALAAIYAGDKKKAEQYCQKAKSLARSDEDKRKVRQLEQVYSEYKTLWKR
ncbi:MAG: tetratricopeptide repeat protein, partial [Desulfovibrio sp.]|nr:tetratricopeptide repeat protein [Desulfovibrio sp.]